MPDYASIAKGIKASKRLGQSFLIDDSIARMEAEYANGRVVVELGAGLGVLTSELCRVAKSVIAVEYDKRLVDYLGANVESKNLKLIHGDFFELDGKAFDKADIMVSNIPYNLSSKVLSWLGERSMPAVLCLQKEFVEHMLAEKGTRSYSKLSVMSRLQFSMYELVQVSRDKFYPQPRVDSVVVFMKPKGAKLGKEESEMINLLMMHKRKKIRNAIIDSAKALGIGKPAAAELAKKIKGNSARLFQIEPEEILEVARSLINVIKVSKAPSKNRKG
jgi:16S rRNA (adenine1518-N6/adenine1519-N6)-dimethyltransferase